MELSSNASPQSRAPLALSELMAQIPPRSDTTHPSDKPASIKQTSKLDAVKEPTQSPVPDEPQTPTTQLQSQQTSPPPSTQEEEDSSPPPTDWLATRQQLLPRKTQGKKADWIRGWSAAVSSHGDAAYCACSEPMESSSIGSDNRGRVGKTSAQFADSVRTALQTVVNPGGKNFTKRVISGLLLRVRRPQRSQSAHKRDAGDVPWPDGYQPRWASTAHGQKRCIARPSSQPLSAPVSAPVEKLRSVSRGDGGGRGGPLGGRVLSWFGGEARSVNNRNGNDGRDDGARGVGFSTSSSSSDLDGITDSDQHHRRTALSRSMSRLQRAAALLQRATNRPKD
ncbi:hypothetical protein N657DRAFT_652921 [Parathielavia appendiculata]|uniref:Uncharacterized protein n=1 Tax=Parathielavia appendiculata TaxID=2587402 RepID=A0AAN6UAP9_9PEZI|nr:hypothetical protein N657DRAFT_652921 [Parathielavia appendiculata]